MNRISSVVSVICKAVALGMGAAVLVLGILDVITPEGGLPMLGIGLFALALSNLQSSANQDS